MAGLRETSASLPASDAALLAYASALLEWQRRSRFCGVCGAPNRLEEAGHLMACTRDGTQHHPRTDPVIIVLATDAMVVPGGVRRAGRVAGGSGRPRDRRGGRPARLGRLVHLQPAMALPGE